MAKQSPLVVPDTKAKPGHDDMVTQSIEQVDPYRANPNDFKYTSHPSRDAQSGLPRGTAEGKDKLAEGMCESPRRLESMDHADLRPSVWGQGGKAFTVETNGGESDEGSPSKVSCSYSVDFSSGQVTPDVAKIRNEEN